MVSRWRFHRLEHGTARCLGLCRNVKLCKAGVRWATTQQEVGVSAIGPESGHSSAKSAASLAAKRLFIASSISSARCISAIHRYGTPLDLLLVDSAKINTATGDRGGKPGKLGFRPGGERPKCGSSFVSLSVRWLQRPSHGPANRRQSVGSP